MLGMGKKKYALPDEPRVIITGGGRGIGRAFCLELAHRKARVLVVDIDLDAAKDTAWALKERGSEAHEHLCDVADEDQVGAMVAKAMELFGGVDLLVNNAGVAVVGDMGDIPLEDWRWGVGINLWGVVYGCHHVVPHMKTQKNGLIINVASIAAVASSALMGPYNVTKAGVLALSETLNVELHQHGIGVTALLPAFVRTAIADGSRTNAPIYHRVAKRLLRDYGTAPEAVARKTLLAAERGELYVFPHALGANVWRFKRLAPNFYARLSRSFFESAWYQKQLDTLGAEEPDSLEEN